MSGFAIRGDEFRALNTKLIGLSIDSIHAHIAWVNKSRSSILKRLFIVLFPDYYKTALQASSNVCAFALVASKAFAFSRTSIAALNSTFALSTSAV